MASTLLRRQLGRASRLAPSPSVSPTPSSSSSLLSAARRHLSRSAAAQAEPAPASTGAMTAGGKNVFDTHTVEDLHGMHATEILAEAGTAREAKMRHFTGELNFLCDDNGYC